MTYELYTYTDDEQTLMFLGPIVNVERHYSNGAITRFEHVDGDVFYEMYSSLGIEMGRGHILRSYDLKSNHLRTEVMDEESDIERDRR